MLTKPVTVELKDTGVFYVKYENKVIKLESFHPYDLANALEKAAVRLREEFEASTERR